MSPPVLREPVEGLAARGRMILYSSHVLDVAIFGDAKLLDDDLPDAVTDLGIKDMTRVTSTASS
jgi:hypothetical protein